MRKPAKRRARLDDIVVLSGRVDASTVATLRETLHAAVDRSQSCLVVDVAGVDTIDATGLGMLIGTQRRANSSGRELVLRGVPVRLARLLKVTRLDRVLRSEATVPVGAV